MTTIALADWVQSPDIIVGEKEHRRLTITALTDITNDADQIDFLLYELDRARVVDDAMLPADIVRLNSVLRYRSGRGAERTVKLVLPEDAPGREDSYRLSATSMHGAALLGLRPGQVLSWIGPDGSAGHVEVIKVANAVGRVGRHGYQP